MAGYVKVWRSIWTDPDFLALCGDDQRVYMLLISQADISHVGVLPLTPGRWAGLDSDHNAKNIRGSLDRLAAANFIILDHDTEELLVKSYIAYDEAHKLTNGPKSLVSAYERVLSPRLRQLVRDQLATLDGKVTVTLDGTVEVYQQTAASSQGTTPAAAAAAVTPPNEPLAAAAAEAVEAYIVYRVNRAKSNPASLDEKLRREVPDEYRERLQAHLARKPAADSRELLRRVFLLNAENTMTAMVEWRKTLDEDRSA